MGNQHINTWQRTEEDYLLEDYLEKLQCKGHEIEQVIISKYTGNSVFKVINKAIIISRKVSD